MSIPSGRLLAFRGSFPVTYKLLVTQNNKGEDKKINTNINTGRSLGEKKKKKPNNVSLLRKGIASVYHLNEKPGMKPHLVGESRSGSGEDCLDICQVNLKWPEWEWPDKQWRRLHVDYAGPFGDSMFLVIMDAHSKLMGPT